MEKTTLVAIRNREAVISAIMQIHAEGRLVRTCEVIEISGVPCASTRNWIKRLRKRKEIPEDVRFIRLTRTNGGAFITQAAIRNRDAVLDAVMQIHAEGRPVEMSEVTKISGVASTTAHDWVKRFIRRGQLPSGVRFARSLASNDSDAAGLSLTAIRNMNDVLKAVLEIHAEGRVISRREVMQLSGVSKESTTRWLARLQLGGRLPPDVQFADEFHPDEMPIGDLQLRLDTLARANRKLGRRVTFDELMTIFPDDQATRREQHAG